MINNEVLYSLHGNIPLDIPLHGAQSGSFRILPVTINQVHKMKITATIPTNEYDTILSNQDIFCIIKYGSKIISIYPFVDRVDDGYDHFTFYMCLDELEVGQDMEVDYIMILPERHLEFTCSSALDVSTSAELIRLSATTTEMTDANILMRNKDCRIGMFLELPTDACRELLDIQTDNDVIIVMELAHGTVTIRSLWPTPSNMNINSMFDKSEWFDWGYPRAVGIPDYHIGSPINFTLSI